MRLLALLLLLADGAAFAQRERLREVHRWAYQLQGRLPRPSAAVDCVVIDGEGAEKGGPLAEQVKQLKQRAGKPDRVVLAYLSIGEAENYRGYWQAEWNAHPPAFLSSENPEWRGNFKVRYWEPEWQAIATAALDRIVAAGFDGVYLDIIDAYEHFEGERPSAPADMSAFVIKLAEHARATRSGFLVVPQNGALLPEALGATGARAYFDAIDAIAAEDTFFFGHRDENNSEKAQADVLAALARFREAGKPVLSVEYLTDGKKIRRFAELAQQKHFVPCVARRSLDRLVEMP